MNKVIRPGTLPTGGGARVSVYCKIEWDGERLSITGVVGPYASGNAYGGCGQIIMEFAQRDDTDARLIHADEIHYAAGWDADLWLDFLGVWEHWHLNDMKAECEHQRALGWTYATHRGQECPECGYEIGTRWLSVEVPGEVIEFLASLPDADREPAWV